MNKCRLVKPFALVRWKTPDRRSV